MNPSLPLSLSSLARFAGLAGLVTLVYAGESRSSARLSAEIRAGLPSFEAPTAPAERPPSNALELPAVTVDVVRTVVPDETEVLTDAALSDLLLKRYPGASVKGQDPTDRGQIRIPNYAAVMYRDDLRLSRLETIQRIEAVHQRAGTLAPGNDLKTEIHRAFLRRPDPLTEVMDRSANPWLRK
ncbi:MAG: hypothetical protein U1F61_28350 [Opitutaceae bacterium]